MYHIYTRKKIVCMPFTPLKFINKVPKKKESMQYNGGGLKPKLSYFLIAK